MVTCTEAPERTGKLTNQTTLGGYPRGIRVSVQKVCPFVSFVCHTSPLPSASHSGPTFRVLIGSSKGLSICLHYWVVKRPVHLSAHVHLSVHRSDPSSMPKPGSAPSQPAAPRRRVSRCSISWMRSSPRERNSPSTLPPLRRHCLSQSFCWDEADTDSVARRHLRLCEKAVRRPRNRDGRTRPPRHRVHAQCLWIQSSKPGLASASSPRPGSRRDTAAGAEISVRKAARHVNSGGRWKPKLSGARPF